MIAAHNVFNPLMRNFDRDLVFDSGNRLLTNLEIFQEKSYGWCNCLADNVLMVPLVWLILNKYLGARHHVRHLGYASVQDTVPDLKDPLL